MLVYAIMIGVCILPGYLARKRIRFSLLYSLAIFGIIEAIVFSNLGPGYTIQAALGASGFWAVIFSLSYLIGFNGRKEIEND